MNQKHGRETNNRNTKSNRNKNEPAVIKQIIQGRFEKLHTKTFENVNERGKKS